MLRAIEGPLIVRPESWTLVFNREAATWWVGWLAFGRYKHVRAYAYVPFLHVWVFIDTHLGGSDVIVTADGEPAQRQIAAWIVNADLIRMRRHLPARRYLTPPFYCVGAVKRLLGLNCGALRPDALYRYCLAHGAEPFEVADGRPAVSAAAA